MTGMELYNLISSSREFPYIYVIEFGFVLQH